MGRAQHQWLYLHALWLANKKSCPSFLFELSISSAAVFSMQGIEAAAEVMVHGYVRLMVESEELAVEMNHGITPMSTTWWFHRRLSRTDKAKLPAPNGKFTTISRNVRQLALLHRRAMGLNSAGR